MSSLAVWPVGDDDLGLDALLTGPILDSPRLASAAARPEDPSAAEAGFEAAAAEIAGGAALPMAEVHGLLRAIAGNAIAVPRCLQVRASAAYLVSRGRRPTAPGPGGGTGAVSVAFQSALNGDKWWSPDDPHDGVAARPMARRARTGEGAGRAHGFRGRQYTLVTRREVGGAMQADKAADVGLVQIWRETDSGDGGAALPRPFASLPPARKRSRAAAPGPRAATSEDDADTARSDGRSDSRSNDSSFRDDPSRTSSASEGDAEGSRLVVEREAHFLRDVVVEGTIRGVLRAPDGAADYAEWFPWCDDLLEREEPLPPPGSVVCLDLRTLALTLETRSQRGPCLVTSTTPSIAAGVPPADGDAACGALVAFLGQVPVRCRGAVAAGDTLVPDGNGDGFAASANVRAGKHDVLGVALGPLPEEGGTVLSFIRWNEAVRREVRTAMAKVLEYAVAILSAAMLWASATLVCVSCFFLGHMTVRAANGRRHISSRFLTFEGHASAQLFLSSMITLDHVFLYVLIALFGRALPLLQGILTEWALAALTIPLCWAYWNAAGRATRFAGSYYMLTLRISYYVVVAASAYRIRRGGVAPAGLASLRFRGLPSPVATALKCAWAPATILVIFVFCMLGPTTSNPAPSVRESMERD